MDWDKLYRKEIEPPYKPNVKNEESTELINREFISVTPKVTPTPNHSVLTDQLVFENFSYVNSAY